MKQEKQQWSIIVKQDKRISVHTSFKRACEAYGWNYKALQRFRPEIGEFKLMKVPVGVTVNCFILLDHCGHKNTDQYIYPTDEDTRVCEFYLNKKTYHVEFEVEEKHEKANYILNEYGDAELESPAKLWEEPSKVVRAWTETKEGNEVDTKLDNWTENELLNIINLD